MSQGLTDTEVLDIPSVEDSKDLEEAIDGLFSHLPSPIITDESNLTSSLPNSQVIKAASFSQQLPPISVQASRIGIKEIVNTVTFIGKGGGKGGKGGKGKQAPVGKQNSIESSPSQCISNGERRRPIADKKIEKLESAASPTFSNENPASEDSAYLLF